MKWEEYEDNFETKSKQLIILVKEKMTAMFQAPDQEWQDGTVNCLGYIDTLNITTTEVLKGIGIK